jgi:hypothetical protein
VIAIEPNILQAIRKNADNQGVKAIADALEAEIIRMRDILVTRNDDVLRGHIQAFQDLYAQITGHGYRDGSGSHVGTRDIPAPTLHTAQSETQRIPAF